MRVLDFITTTDFYKTDHRRQMERGTQRIYENWTPRAPREQGWDWVVSFGLQAALKYDLTDLANRTFFSRSRSDVLYDYQLMLDNCLGPTEIGTEHIGALHDLQYIPLEFCALPEGTKTPYRVPMFTVENTHSDFAWVSGYLETLLSSRIWIASTSATTAHRYRRLLETYAELTGGSADFVKWQGHDFSFRGMASPEAAAMSGAGHLLSFTGTDTIPAIKLLHDCYGGEGLIGGSVAATEHMVMSLGGKKSERETYQRLLKLYPKGIVSIVSDTYDLWKILTETLPSLKSQIMARDGKLVIRPDSGDPVLIITGDATQPPGSPAHKGVIELLWETFGGTVNAKDYRELDSHIGAIYGDSITEERARQICERLKAKGFASTNIVLGIGSYCVGIDTPILCTDLIWRRAGDLEIGQEIIAFDEDPSFGEGRRAARRYRAARIEANAPAKKLCYQIETDCGPPLIISHDHPMLIWAKNRRAGRIYADGQRRPPGTGSPRTPGFEWRTASELKIGDQVGFFAEPWSEDVTRETGWLAGMYDGEGCISRLRPWKPTLKTSHYKVNISQNEGPLMERVRSALSARGFSWYENKRKCPQLVINGGWSETLRFLGQVRPYRLLEKLPKLMGDMPAMTRHGTCSLATITKIEEIGESTVASIRTSTGTFITAGYLSHNTYQYCTRDTHGFAIKATWAKVRGEERFLFKDPVTDNGVKKSARGRLAVVEVEGALCLVDGLDLEAQRTYPRNLLQPVWRDGRFLRRHTLAEIRARVRL
jgi:nicotinamide phosphoribosyltransferase